MRKGKRVQLRVCAVQRGTGRERVDAQWEEQSFERTVASAPLGLLKGT